MTLMPEPAPTEAIIKKLPSKVFRDWVSTPGRQPGDVKIMKHPQGPVILGILEMTEWAHGSVRRGLSQDRAVIKNGQRASLEARMLIDMIARAWRLTRPNSPTSCSMKPIACVPSFAPTRY